MNRTFVYSSSRRSITVEGLKAYNATGGGIEGASDDELILYAWCLRKRMPTSSLIYSYEKKQVTIWTMTGMVIHLMQNRRMNSCFIQGIWISTQTRK